MPLQTDHLTFKIQAGADEIVRLRSRVHEAFLLRDSGPEKFEEWTNACREFHSRYNMLAFPGGLEGAYERILAGDPEAMEAAVCFLEVRPYFFRSGYMFDSILRKAKRAPLSREQSERLEAVIQAVAAWRANKAMKRNA